MDHVYYDGVEDEALLYTVYSGPIDHFYAVRKYAVQRSTKKEEELECKEIWNGVE
jgi:hypothetical protein